MRAFSVMLIAACVLTGCSDPKPEKTLVNNDSLSEIIKYKQWAVDNYRQYLNEVSGILNSISRKSSKIKN